MTAEAVQGSLGLGRASMVFPEKGRASRRGWGKPRPRFLFLSKKYFSQTFLSLRYILVVAWYRDKMNEKVSVLEQNMS